MNTNKPYRIFDSDSLTCGRIKIDHTLMLFKPDISELISKPIDVVQAMCNESKDKENER